MSEEKEKHRRRFTGVFYPKAVWDAYDEGQLTPLEFVLLGLITALDREEEGCFASNAYLAEQVRTSERHLLRMINNLRALSFVRRTTTDEGRRLFSMLCIKDWVKAERGGDTHVTPRVTPMSPRSPMKLAQHDIKDDSRVITRPGFSEEVSFEKKWAKRLQAVIVQQFSIVKDARSWPRILTHMQRFGGVSQERIKAAIKWYEIHAGDLFAPHIEDAQAFRNKFAALEKQMKVAETPKVRTVQISDDAQEILDTMKANDGFTWPKGSGRDVPELVQASLDAFAAYQAKRKAIVSTWRDHGLIFNDQHINDHLGPGSRFILRWVRRVHASIENWDEWRGQLSYFHWSMTHPNFRKMIIEAVPDVREKDVDEYLRRMAA